MLQVKEKGKKKVIVATIEGLVDTGLLYLSYKKNHKSKPCVSQAGTVFKASLTTLIPAFTAPFKTTFILKGLLPSNLAVFPRIINSYAGHAWLPPYPQTQAPWSAFKFQSTEEVLE